MSPFWTAFWILVIIVPLVIIWVFGLIDVFRRPDLSGLAKALWVLAILYLPIIGMIVYFVARPMSELEGPGDYLGGAGGITPAEEVKLLADLNDRGKLSDEEFAHEKGKILGAVRVNRPT